MRLLSRTTLIAGLALTAAVGGTASAGSAVDRATGGGQILVDSSGHGPGDTITFQARNTGDGDTATGSVNVIDRVQGATTGRGQGYHFKGTVICMQVSGKVAKLAGTGTKADGSSTAFTLLVEDNGEGAAADSDMIALNYVSSPDCDRQDGDDDGNTDLARGNAQVYDAS